MKPIHPIITLNINGGPGIRIGYHTGLCCSTYYRSRFIFLSTLLNCVTCFSISSSFIHPLIVNVFQSPCCNLPWLLSLQAVIRICIKFGSARAELAYFSSLPCRRPPAPVGRHISATLNTFDFSTRLAPACVFSFRVLGADAPIDESIA